ncbi:MAG TPA: O-antigen ligase family protein [Candidatus Saccharimonadales bacterium]|nr:O-antigen ligase family protein [Candidatus Saccharimonadales bacterium]
MQLSRRILRIGVIALLVYMPFHVFLSQSLSLLTGGLEVWKAAKDVALALLTVFAVCLVFWRGRAERWYTTLLGIAAAYAVLHVLLFVIFKHKLYAESAYIGIIYNLRVVCYLVLGASAASLYARVFAFRSIIKIITGVASVIALLGVLQYFLPKDLLTHAGYSLDRGVRPMFFIDDNPAFPRIMSTLRDPNSLGAYLLVPLAVLTMYALRARNYVRSRQLLIYGLLGLHIVALYLTFSRSAWLAAIIVVALVIWWQFSSLFVHVIRRYWIVGVAAVVIVGVSVYMLRNNPHIDGVLTHSTAAQSGPIDSNEYHWLFVRRGISGIVQQPLGHGPGTAGLASIQNPYGTGILTENYYVQIGYEVGVVGLALFIALQVFIYIRLYKRRDEWSIVLLAAFWGYVVTSMLLHTWSNEAVAAQWWLLAGLAIGLPLASSTHKARHPREGGDPVE